MSKIIQPNIDYDIRLRMIHDECFLILDQYIYTFINDRSKLNYELLKDKLFEYYNMAIKHNTPITKQLKSDEIQVNSFDIGIVDCNQTRIVNTYITASNTYEDFINQTMFSKNHITTNNIQYLSVIRSAFYGYHGGRKFCNYCHTDLDIYVEPHRSKSYFLTVYYITKDNIRIPNQISKFIPDHYSIIDNRLKAIHDELNNEVSHLITQFIDDKTEINYNNLKDIVFDYLNKVIKCETNVTSQLKLIGKQINSPRIMICDQNNMFIIDAHKTAYNSLNNYFTKTIHDIHPIHRLFIEDVFVILYGKYGGTKFSYTLQQNMNYYIEAHQNYYLNIFCLSDENVMDNKNVEKLELIEYKPIIDTKLQIFQDELYIEIEEIITIFINDRTESNYNNLKDRVFDYLDKFIKYSMIKINSPRIIIIDCDFIYIMDTDKQTENTLNNYLEGTLYDNIPNHYLTPSSIKVAFYGYDSGTIYSLVLQKNVNYYVKAYDPIFNLSQASYYIVVTCLHDENII